jgi:hypothetical protein
VARYGHVVLVRERIDDGATDGAGAADNKYIHGS